MNEIYLKFPTIEDKEEWLNYVKEIKLENPMQSREILKKIYYMKNGLII